MERIKGQEINIKKENQTQRKIKKISTVASTSSLKFLILIL